MVGKIHKYDRNEETGNLKCPYCPYETKKQNTVSEHVRRKHAEIAARPIMANVCHCGRKFQTRTELVQHLNSKTHATEETAQFECPECHEKMAKKETLINHYVRYHLQDVQLMRQIDVFHSQCCHCEKVMKTTSMTYHVGVCNPASPFAKASKKTPSSSHDEFTEFMMFIHRAAQKH
jgi:hypothetical protein